MDPTPWNLLHDGTIVGVERDLADEVRIAVDVPYLRDRWADGGTLFHLRLARCTRCEYTPYDEPPIAAIAAIAASEPTIVEAKLEGDDLVVWGSAGVLRLRYASLAIELDTGPRVELADLARVAQAYWAEWRAHWKQP